ADWHLRRLVGREPARASFFGRRGAVYARLGQWDQAAADGAKTLELGDKRLKVERDYALLCLATANTDQYRRTCARLLERFGQTKDPAVANNVAWACVLAPNAVDDAKRPLQLAEKAVYIHPGVANYLTTLGAALYRANRPEEAVQRLNQAIRLE